MDVLEKFALQFPESTEAIGEVLQQALEFAEQALSSAERQKLATDLQWLSIMTPSARDLRLREVGWTYLPDDPEEEDAFFVELSSLIASPGN